MFRLTILLIALVGLLAATCGAASASDLQIAVTDEAGTPRDRAEAFDLDSDLDPFVVVRRLKITNAGPDAVTYPAFRLTASEPVGSGECLEAYTCFNHEDWIYFDTTLQPGQTASWLYRWYPQFPEAPAEPSGWIEAAATGRAERNPDTGQTEIVALGDPTPDNVARLDWQWRWRRTTAGIENQAGDVARVGAGATFSFQVPIYNRGPDPFRQRLRVGVWGGAQGVDVVDASLPGAACAVGESLDDGAPGVACLLDFLAPGAVVPLTVTARAARGGGNVGVTMGMASIPFGDSNMTGAYLGDDIDDQQRSYGFCVPGAAVRACDGGEPVLAATPAGGSPAGPAAPPAGGQAGGSPAGAPALVAPKGVVRVKRLKFSLPFRCTNPNGCRGARFTLTGRIRGGKKVRIPVDVAPLGPGQRTTAVVRLFRPTWLALRGGVNNRRTTTLKLTGGGIKPATIKLRLR